MALTQYAWAVGHNVALIALTPFEDYIWEYTKPRFYPPTSGPIERFPVRAVTLDEEERGEGGLSAVWSVILPIAAWKYLLQTVWTVTSNPVTSRDMTVYTVDEVLDFARYNVKAARPRVVTDSGRGARRDQRHMVDVTIRFTKMVRL